MLAVAKMRNFPVELIVRKRTDSVAGLVGVLEDDFAEIREVPTGLPVVVPYADVEQVRLAEPAVERWLNA